MCTCVAEDALQMACVEFRTLSVRVSLAPPYASPSLPHGVQAPRLLPKRSRAISCRCTGASTATDAQVNKQHEFGTDKQGQTS